MAEPTSTSSKGSIASFVVFVLFGVTLAVLYFNNRMQWVSEVSRATALADSLTIDIEEIIVLREKEAARILAAQGNNFDSYDSDDYRVYGLYRDEERKYSAVQTGAMFNVHPPSAIKTTNVLRERWHIIPVKTIHYFDGSETMGDIAKLYYQNIADSTLIPKFNQEIKPGKHLFIPFD